MNDHHTMLYEKLSKHTKFYLLSQNRKKGDGAIEERSQRGERGEIQPRGKGGKGDESVRLMRTG